MVDKKHVLVTGGAGYIGSLLTSILLGANWRVTVVDNLLYGGESLLAFFSHPDFHFAKADVTEAGAVRSSLRKDWQKPQAIVHLAGIVGFPACQAVGKQAAWWYNVDAVKRVHDQAVSLGCEKFIFTSTYSVYGISEDGKPVSEESPLNPHSLYAETKIAAEEYLLSRGSSNSNSLIFRLATLYGISPRTRFDLIVNQFVLDAFLKRELIIYQRGYSRSFIHVKDVASGILLGLKATGKKVIRQVYNLGANNGNYTKDQIVGIVLKRLPDTHVVYKDMTFGGDMRDIAVSFDKVSSKLGFQATLSVENGVRELVLALRTGIIHNPRDERYTNARFIVQ
jgi:nucleoside-diphosphate-sugar epimerase